MGFSNIYYISFFKGLEEKAITESNVNVNCTVVIVKLFCRNCELNCVKYNVSIKIISCIVRVHDLHH